MRDCIKGSHHQEDEEHCTRPITELEAGEVESVAHEEVFYSTKELNEFVNSVKQKSGEYMEEWILRIWDNGERTIKLDQTEFIDMDPMSGDLRFNLKACIVKKK